MLITISREYGAGGSSVAHLVAERLGWRLVDNQLVEEIARRAGLTTAQAEERVERGPTFIERLARAFARSSPEALAPTAATPPETEEARLKQITEQVVSDAAGDHAVLVGRAASAVIGRRADALHVKLVGSLEYRTQIVADRLGIPFEAAARRVRDEDAHRAEYHRRWYQRDWADPHHYHLVVNGGWLGLETAADLIVALVKLRQ
ncbi:MAG: AAA family ATPase [Gemmatimonadales bacterium]